MAAEADGPDSQQAEALDDVCDEALTQLVGGSSPLARGTHRRGGVEAARDRFIPARAGNTIDAILQRAGATVHPRSRGEHESRNLSLTSPYGSSPLARGTQFQAQDVLEDLRFIPARAGNTSLAGATTPRHPVHPRSRGEHATSRDCTATITGSSPLARGTRTEARGRISAARFIPARAGNTSARRRPR